ncbi:MAG: MerR family transcriptional regulator [Eubacteriales bacterium]
MLMKEVCIQCALTKKAVEYYTEQGLIHPAVLENGYRDFDNSDIECLKKIAVLRKLDLSIEEIKGVLNDPHCDILRRISYQKELKIGREKTKLNLLKKLSIEGDFEKIRSKLAMVEQNSTIIEKLLDTFPGYYGRFASLHFLRFMNEPITTDSQQEAFDVIVEFLDSTPNLVFPEDLQRYLDENTKHIGAQGISDMITHVKKSIENPEAFMAENKEMLQWYITYKNSDEYKNSAAYKLMALMKEFGSTSGYYDIFLPAMRKLSPSYDEYYKQLEEANDKLIQEYPEILEWNS